VEALTGCRVNVTTLDGRNLSHSNYWYCKSEDWKGSSKWRNAHWQGAWTERKPSNQLWH
jgi:hypothetical protein